MSRPRTVPPAMFAPTHSRPEGTRARLVTETAVHTMGLPEGHFAAIVMSRPEPAGSAFPDLAVIAILDRDEVEEHIRLLRNAIEDAERLDAGLPTIHASGKH